MASQRRPRSGALLPGIVLVAVGVALLFGNFGAFAGDFWSALWSLWPVLPIAIGANILVARRYPSAGAATAAAILLAGVIAAAIFAATDSGPARGNFGFGSIFIGGERGSGTAVHVDRQLDAFDELRLRGSFDVVVRVGAPQSVRVTTDDNLVDRLRTEVHDRRLTIESHGPIAPRTATRVDVTLPALRAASVDGSGSVSIEGLAGDEIELSVSGSGDIKAEGRVQRLLARISGSGDIAATDLRAESVDVTVTGSGDAAVYAARSLDAHVIGSGDITYEGNPPEVQTDEQGSGGIHGR